MYQVSKRYKAHAKKIKKIKSSNSKIDAIQSLVKISTL